MQWVQPLSFLMKKSSFLHLQQSRARCPWHLVHCQWTNFPTARKTFWRQKDFIPMLVYPKISHHQQTKSTAILSRQGHIRPTTAASIGRAGKLIIRVSQRQASMTNANYIKKKEDTQSWKQHMVESGRSIGLVREALLRCGTRSCERVSNCSSDVLLSVHNWLHHTFNNP